MDRLLSRAKDIETGNWVIGYYRELRPAGHTYNKFNGHRIYQKGFVSGRHDVTIDVDTLCQCTGRKDKNGNLIFENDIVNVHFPKNIKGEGLAFVNGIYKVFWHDYQFQLDRFYCTCFDIPYDAFSELKQEDIEVIGNIFDNPELLEVQDD